MSSKTMKKKRGLPTRTKNVFINKLKHEYAQVDKRHTEGEDIEENFPKNWLVGRVGDQHTDLTLSDREYDDEDSNFITRNSGQPGTDDEIEESIISELLILKPNTIIGLLPRSVFTGKDMSQGKELILSLANTLNQFYKDNHINIRIK